MFFPWHWLKPLWRAPKIPQCRKNPDIEFIEAIGKQAHAMLFKPITARQISLCFTVEFLNLESVAKFTGSNAKISLPKPKTSEKIHTSVYSHKCMQNNSTCFESIILKKHLKQVQKNTNMYTGTVMSLHIVTFLIL